MPSSPPDPSNFRPLTQRDRRLIHQFRGLSSDSFEAVLWEPKDFQKVLANHPDRKLWKGEGNSPMDLLRKNWEAIVGKRLAETTWPVTFRQGLLTVQAKSAPASSDFSFGQRRYLTLIREVKGFESIRDIRCRLAE
jgi:hypothetical protein